MKKTTLLLCLFMASVMMPQSVWADVTITSGTNEVTINSPAAGDLNSHNFTQEERGLFGATTIKLVGKFSSADLDRLRNEGLCTATTVDMSQAVFAKAVSYSNYILYDTGEPNSSDGNVGDMRIYGSTLYESQGGESVKRIDEITEAEYNAQNGNTEEPGDWSVREIDSRSNDGKYYKLMLADYYKKAFWEKIESPTSEQTGNAQSAESLDWLNQNRQNNTNDIYKVGDTYYSYAPKWESIEVSSIPDGANITYYKETYIDGAHISEGSPIAGFLNKYVFYHVYSEISFSWSQKSYDNGRTYQISIRSALEEDLTLPTDYGQLALVGGTEYVKSNDGWNTVLLSSDNTDYSAIKFNYWTNMTSAILPNNVSMVSCPDNLFKGCHSLTSVTHNVNNEALTAGISISGTGENTVVTINSTGEAGLFRLLLNSDAKLTDFNATERFASGTTFVFADNCAPSAADLAALAGRIESSNSLSTNHNKFYVDLFNLSTDEATTGSVVSEAIGLLRANNWQYKGLLLPGNLTSATTQYIKDRDDDNVKLATCSEFIGYNKSQNTVTTMHIYGVSGTTDEEYQNRFNKLKSMMDSHEVISQSTTSYVVSTNDQNAIDISSLPTSNADIVEIVNDNMVEPVPGAKADIYVILEDAGRFASVSSAVHIQQTPTNKLVIAGKVNVDDISVVNGFGDNNGPAVLDLKAAVPTPKNSESFNDKAMLESLTNSELEFIILDKGKSKDVVCGANYSTSLTNLKAVISSNVISDQSHNLVAYVKTPGSLGEARYLATGGSFEGVSPNLTFKPTSQQLTSVILSGNLRNSDIQTANDGGLANEAKLIESLDLEGAVFLNASGKIDPNEMNFKDAGFSGTADVDIVLKSIILPTNAEMDEISKDCFNGMHSLKSLCIPFNYKVIHDGALNETGLDHLTTTDGYDGNVVDNGPKTYTLSANLQQLGDAPNPKISDVGEFVGVQPVFPKNNGVGDLYTLATKVPKCYKDVFGMDLSTGYGGQDQTKVYCRERYYNNGDANNAFMILHIPNEESFNRAKEADATNAEDYYSTMVNFYTDDTKVYSKLDQTGAVDANGKPMRWPMHNEMLRVYKQASAGLVWKDWTVGDDKDQNGLKVLYGPSPGEPSINENSVFYNYIGWHQIVLTQATYVDPVETSTRNYVKSGWYTFCIPYNLTYSQVVRMLGVPASTDNVKNYIANGEVLADSMPDIRQLKEVVRRKGSGNEHNVVNFRLTENLYKGNKVTKYLNFTEIDDDHTDMSEVDAGSGDDPICLVGGRPYYIQPYLPEDVTISKSNLGKYIMTRYANELTLAASCINNTEDYYENLEIFSYNDDRTVKQIDENSTNTMHFAKPYEKHKVQAVTDDKDNPGQLVYTTESKSKSTATHKYYYTMIGQFWEQELPAYCVYMSGQQWYRYGDGSSKFKWAPYKCVIMATPEVTCVDDVTDEDIVDAFSKPAPTTPEHIDDHIKPDQLPANTPKDLEGYSFNHFGGGFRDIKNCYFPMNVPGTKDLLPSPLTLWFVGRDDSSFDNDKPVGRPTPPTPTRYIFSFDDDVDIVELDGQDNETTVIKTLDGAPQFTTGEERVYNLSGQYVGRSTEGLARGVYIVGGRKVVVD